MLRSHRRRRCGRRRRPARCWSAFSELAKSDGTTSTTTMMKLEKMANSNLLLRNINFSQACFKVNCEDVSYCVDAQLAAML